MLSLEELENVAEKIGSSVEFLNGLIALKRGRKTLDASGEIRDKKIMLYVTATTMNKLKELATLYHTSITECVIGLIDMKHEEKQKKIQELNSMFETL